jgi:hypothetical protein
LEQYKNWDEKKRKLFFSTVNYINSSSKGFLEDRLLRICIAWEGLADHLLSEKNKSDSDLKELKESLKSLIENFNLSGKYDKNFIKDRVINSLDWERLYQSLSRLCEQYELKSEKIGLYFKSLIKIRNDIAHTGQFRNKLDIDFLVKTLYNHRFGIQLILLKELGYDNIIESQENNWRTLRNIQEFMN